MVFKRRLDSGSSNGFNVPNIPKAPRSCRRRVLRKRSDDDDEICAFDLLASLAGKLLQESESSSASNNAIEVDNQIGVRKDIKEEQQDECKPLETGFPDQGLFDAKSTYKNTTEKCSLNKCSFLENDHILERISESSDCGVNDLKPVGCEDKEGFCNFFTKLGGNTGKAGDVSVNNGFEEKGEAVEGMGDGGLIVETCCSKDTTELCAAFPELVHSDEHRKLPACMNPVPGASFARHGNLNKLGSRDDDEKFYRSYKFSSKPYRPPTRIGDRRIRKLLSSKYWKAVPMLKDYEYSRADGGRRSLYHKRKTCHGYNRWQNDIVYKRKRSSGIGSVVTSDGGLSSESVSYSPEKGDAIANGVLSPSLGLRSKNSHVKFNIKSFKIPELFIEVPETATVGTLKRTILEAVTALLGGGVRVGVLVQGKKVRDDSKTLSQTGLSRDENLGRLGFTLEPGPDKTLTLLCSDDTLVPSDSTVLSKKSPAYPVLDCGIPISSTESDELNNSSNHVENNNCELILYQSGISADEPTSESRDLVPVPALDVEALAIVPVNQKSKRSELTHRRTRRPFSVTEVEVLVQAVEELGTGRWRDVKLGAFENADHRTYVDLKDKWKTLVHTASISPQQRRGEPVPQELLDRVLAAHAFWSQQQARQDGKHQVGTPKTADNQATADRNLVGTVELQTGSM